MADNDDKKSPDQTEKPDESRFGLEFGVDTNLPFATPFNPVALGVGKSRDEELLEILHEESEQVGPTVRQLISMRRMDGQARALYRLLTHPIRSALDTATFTAAEDGDEENEFIKNVFFTAPENGGMTVTFHRFMSQMLMGLFDGFAPFEKVFWVPEDGPMANKITLKKLAHRPVDTITFVSDKHGGFSGLRQRASHGGKVVDVYIPKEYSFYYAAQEEERKFYGVSYFQAAFYHYDKKVRIYHMAHLASQRAAVGTRVGTFPQNATEQQKRDFAQQLNNLAMAQWMMLPDTFTAEVLKEGGSFDFMSFVNHHNSAMSKSILANFFDESSGGENTLVNFGQPGNEMFILMLRGIMDEIANQINHYIIPQLIDFNFPTKKYPTFTWGTLTDEQNANIQKTFETIMTSQPEDITPEFVRALEEHQAKKMGLDIDYDAIEEREAAAAAVAAAQGQQIDPTTGQPVPQAPGQPAPGTAAPTDPAAAPAAADAAVDSQAAQFEQEVAKLSAPKPDDEGMAQVLKMADSLLDAAWDEARRDRD
jgi:hypothetical protein